MFGGSKKALQERLKQLEAENKVLSESHEKEKNAHAATKATLTAVRGEHDKLKGENGNIQAVHEGEVEKLQGEIDDLKGKSIEILDKSMEEVKVLKQELEEQRARADKLQNQAGEVAEDGAASKVESKSAGGGASSSADKAQLEALTRQLAEAKAEADEHRKHALALTEEWDDKVREIEEMNNTRVLGQKLREAEKSAFKSSQELVLQAEKNFKLFDELQKYKDESTKAREEVKNVRSMLIREIAGSGAKVKAYEHIPIPELVRLLGQALARGSNAGDASMKMTSGSMSSTIASDAGEKSDGGDKLSKTMQGAESWTLDSIRTVESEMKNMRSTIRQLQKDLQAQKDINEQGLAAMDTVIQLKEKSHDLTNRYTRQKEKTEEAREEIRRSNDRVKALSEHIEKLMVHLKHEAAAKARASAANRRTTKELNLFQQRNEALINKNRSREKVIRELREGCRILEDQLRLMDEKYIELRNKLDWTRNQSQKEVRKIQAEANKLRVKWMMVAGSDQTLKSLGMDSPQTLDNGIHRSASVPGLGNKGGRKRPNTISGPTELPPLMDPAPGQTMNNLFANGVPEQGSVEDTGEPWGDGKLNSLHTWAAGDGPTD